MPPVQLTLTITATLTPDGKMQVETNGPIDKPGICLRLLAMAEQTIKNHAVQKELAEGPGIIAAPAGALPPSSFNPRR